MESLGDTITPKPWPPIRIKHPIRTQYRFPTNKRRSNNDPVKRISMMLGQ